MAIARRDQVDQSQGRGWLEPKGGPGGQKGAPTRRRSGTGAEPRPVTESLAAAARRIGAPGALDLADMERRWPALVGPNVAAHCRPVAFRAGELVVATDHPAWASQLRLLADDVVHKAQASGLRVGSMTVRVGALPSSDW